MINTVAADRVLYASSAPSTPRAERRTDRRGIGELWLDVQGESLGPAIEVKPGYETFWPYLAFCRFAVLCLRLRVRRLPGELSDAAYEKAEAGFEERYLAMLSAGGTNIIRSSFLLLGWMPATRLLAVRMGLIERMIEELESL